MDRADIKAGVIYASHHSYKDGQSEDWPRPVVFLEDGAATLYGRWVERTAHASARQTGWSTPRAARTRLRGGAAEPGMDGDQQFGYPVVRLSQGETPFDVALAAMRRMDPAAELRRFLGGRYAPSFEGGYFDFVTDLDSIHGQYDFELAIYRASHR